MSLCSIGLYGKLYKTPSPDPTTRAMLVCRQSSHVATKPFHLLAYSRHIDQECALIWECLNIQGSLQGTRPVISSCVVCFVTVAGSYRTTSLVLTTGRTIVCLARMELSTQGYLGKLFQHQGGPHFFYPTYFYWRIGLMFPEGYLHVFNDTATVLHRGPFSEAHFRTRVMRLVLLSSPHPIQHLEIIKPIDNVHSFIVN